MGNFHKNQPNHKNIIHLKKNNIKLLFNGHKYLPQKFFFFKSFFVKYIFIRKKVEKKKLAFKKTSEVIMQSPAILN